jgi:hypothetical protein
VLQLLLQVLQLSRHAWWLLLLLILQPLVLLPCLLLLLLPLQALQALLLLLLLLLLLQCLLCLPRWHLQHHTLGFGRCKHSQHATAQQGSGQVA